MYTYIYALNNTHNNKLAQEIIFDFDDFSNFGACSFLNAIQSSSEAFTTKQITFYTHKGIKIMYFNTRFVTKRFHPWIVEKMLPSSLSVNLPICGNNLNCSKQMTPAHSILMIATWSCLTKRGLVFDFSPVFLSMRHIKA